MERLRRIGVFGGSFDPPHLGHLILAAEALDQLNLDRVLWVLTPDPPHKQGQDRQSPDDRLEMLHIAISDISEFELSRVDIERAPPYYAADTLRLLTKQTPQAQLVYLIGGDSLHDLPGWHKPAEILASCHALGVMRRPGDAVDLAMLEQSIPGISKKVQIVNAPLLEISSNEIRQRIAAGRPFRFFVPTGVYFLIRERRLYGYQNE